MRYSMMSPLKPRVYEIHFKSKRGLEKRFFLDDLINILRKDELSRKNANEEE